MKQLAYLRDIQETVDSLMGPVVFDVGQMENGMMISCTLEALGYVENIQREKKKELYVILIKAISYIKESFGWEVGVLRGKQRYLIPDAEDYHYLHYKDQCVLFVKKPEPKPIPKAPTIKPTVTTRVVPDPGCSIF